jgi:hypothetical protein
MINGLASVVQNIPTRERAVREAPISLSPKTEKPYVSEPVDYSSRVEEMNERDSYNSCWDSSD